MHNKQLVGKVLLIIFLAFTVGVLASGKMPLPITSMQNWLDLLRINLGLDLQGGLHLDYEIDLSDIEDQDTDDALAAVQAVIERRVNAIGVGEPTVQIANRGFDKFLIVELPGVRNIDQAKEIIKETPFLEFREERSPEEIEAYFEPLNREAKEGADAALERVNSGEDFNLVQAEVDPLSVLQEDTQEEGEDNQQFVKRGILAGAPAIEAVLFDDAVSPNSVFEEIVESEVAYHIVKKGDVRGEGEDQEVGYELITFIKQNQRTNPSELYKSTELTGEFLDKAEVTFSHQGAQRPEVSIFFNSDGSEMFRELTGRSIGKTIAIAVDDQIISAPSVGFELAGGQAQITGNFSIDEASALAGRLNEGALPVPIELVSQQSVEASLGAEALTTSLKAGLIGLVFVMIYMIIFYRFFGLVAALAIAFYALTLIAIFKLSSTLPAGLSITLTLSGIAGLILSIGMAVDANILIYERIHEEIKRGRRIHHAIEEGFARAWSAIRDGNISTILTCLILTIIGTGFVKGFALILIIGVLLSMFTAVVLVRIVIRASAGSWLSQRPWLIARGLKAPSSTKESK